MKLRNVLLAAAMLVTGTAIGATTQHLASAGVSSGERPVLVPIVPCRLTDTRPAPNTVGPRSAPLAGADTATIEVQDPSTECVGEIPGDATALSLNVTALGATAQSFLTIWSEGDRPLAASLNPAPGEPPVPNAVTTALSSAQSFKVYNNAGSVNVVIDVNGYYVDHDHDDRYYTKNEVDTAISEAHEFVHERFFPVGVEAPAFVPDEVNDTVPLTVTTAVAGRWQIDVNIGYRRTCAGGFGWYFVMVDGVPVESTLEAVSNAADARRTYSGFIDEVIAAGQHDVRVAVECVGAFNASGTSSGVGTVNVVVMP